MHYHPKHDDGCSRLLPSAGSEHQACDEINDHKESMETRKMGTRSWLAGIG